MRKARFEFSEVALSQVENLYGTIKKLVNGKNYDSLKIILRDIKLSAKQYYHLLDELIFVDKLFNDVEFAKILFSSELQQLNDEYRDGFGEPLIHAMLYQINDIGRDLIYELIMDKDSKIRLNMKNVNFDNTLQLVIDVANNFTNEQFLNIVKKLVYEEKNSNDVMNVNDFGKNALELFIYRKRKNNDVFNILFNEWKKEKENSLNSKLRDFCRHHLENIDEKLNKKCKDRYETMELMEKRSEMITAFMNEMKN